MEPAGTTVADLVEAAVDRWPDATAVVAGSRSLTFAELDAQANRFAHHLQSLGVGPDVLVGVCLPRSAELAVALLAVLKAGGGCVPLDPAHPAERLAFMAADAHVAAVVTSTATPGVPGPRLLVDADAAAWADRPSSRPDRGAGPDDVAYVIYTSGSTGVPKGVLLTHRGLVNHHRAAVDLYDLAPGDRVLQFCSLGFDASIEEMFPTWAAGATVVYRPEDAPLLGRAWLDWLRDQGVTVVNLPTAYWQSWARDLEASGERVPDDIRLVVVGGEQARGTVYRAWLRVGGGRARWVNAYGPTETTCMSTSWEAVPGRELADGEDPPIGRPLPNTTVLVVDEGLRPVSDGDTGELLIGGDGLARGYLGRAELTAERFVEGPAGGRFYRTGDLVRRRPDGDLDFVGRLDDQVKIQGFRVECGEVEAALSRHPAVVAAAVVGREEPPGERQLVAYVVRGQGRSAVDAVALRRFLAGRLPAHMVPARFVALDALPLTANGKLDRPALPPPAAEPVPTAVVATRSAAEAAMAAIWARVLGLDAATLGPGDDFFGLGGHSLLATQVIAQVREEFATDTPLRALFEAPTLAGLTAVVAAERGVPVEGASPLRRRPQAPGDAVPLSLAQEQMWALEARAQPPGLYNFTAVHRFDTPVDVAALRRALASLVDRHEILRTGFALDADRPRQRVAASAAAELTVVDVSGQPASDVERRMADQEARPFELAQPPLFRAGLYLGDGGRSRLAVTFDHLVNDGTGAAIFVTELLAAYAATAAGQPPAFALPALDVQFPDFTVWQRSRVTDSLLRRQLEWWTEALAGMPLGPAVPVDHLPETPTRRVAFVPVAVDATLRAGLEQVARTTGSTVFAVATAAAAAVFGRYGGITDVALSTTVSGRTRAELQGLIGMFSGMSRIRVDLSGDPACTTVVRRAREWLLRMAENQDVPFLRVRRAVWPDFPTEGPAVAAALPVEFQYFHAREDQEFLFRGQLHPLSLTLLDDGYRLDGELGYKLDFYEADTVEALARDLDRVLRAVAADPSRRLSDLPISPPERR